MVKKRSDIKKYIIKQLYKYYKLDNEYEKLFDLVRKESISILNKYEDYLKNAILKKFYQSIVII